MYQYGIVVIGYKNVEAIKRLLNALRMADYGDNKDVRLIISIDRSDGDRIEKVADEFQWDFGEKCVVTFPKRLGLREHVLHCGDYLNRYDLDALVVFEDDMMPSRNFFHFVKVSTEKYIDNENIAGTSLYTHCINFNTGERFTPVKNDGDNYFFQCAQSRGQVWYRKQWNEFREWYKTERKLDADCSIPESVTAWPETSWLKYHIKYCVERNKYFVYPYISYSTCFGEVGEHVNMQTDSLQVPISNARLKSFLLIDFNDNALKYDAFFENQSLHKYCGIAREDLLVDLYGDHINTDKRYILTKKKLPYRIIHSWGNRLVPHEMNVIYNIPGSDIFLYDLNNIRKSIELPKQKVPKDKMEIYFDILNRWMTLEEEGINIQNYFLDNKWYHIAIYGKGKLGMHLYNRLRNTEVRVDYFIDRDTKRIAKDVQTISLNGVFTSVDAVVVTPVLEFEQIKENLEKCGIDNVISMNDIFK